MEYRSVLEVCKFSAPADILQELGAVCSNWAKACASDELWFSYLEIRGYPANPILAFSPKAWFSYLNYRACCIPLVRRDYFALFFCRKSQWSASVPLLAPIQADQVSASTILPDGSLLCCGGGNWRTEASWDSAYRLLSDGRVIQLKDLCQAREAHGILCCLSSVYVFGGDTNAGPPVLSGERLAIGDIQTLQDRSWTLLLNMNFGHSYFTPALYRGLVYLCGGYSNTSEVFNPLDDLFSVVAMRLTDPEHCWEVVKGEELIIVTGYKMHVLKGLAGSQRLHRKPGYSRDEYSSVPPVLIGNIAFRLLMSGDVLQTDLETREEATVLKPRRRP